MMSGVARSESWHSLNMFCEAVGGVSGGAHLGGKSKRTIVLRPPIIISEWYSSSARLSSPTAGTYLITI